jgi:topoisomerase-4 subunit A
MPSARGQGEPLNSKLNPESGASFTGMLIGNPEQLILLASDFGYGFIAKLEDLYTKNKNGKAVLSLPKSAKTLTPRLITNLAAQYLVVVTYEGRMLILPISSMPILARGKGNKIINIPSAQAAKREDYIVDLIIINATDKLVLVSGKQKLTLNFNDLGAYKTARGSRGNKLPKGVVHIDNIGVK